MRKYVVPIVALAGIALLSPSADAAKLWIKSRAGVPGRPVSVPVSVTDVSANQLFGLDMALTFDTTRLSAATDAGTGAAFTPEAVAGSTETPVVVSGTTFVGTGATNPNLYVGIVRGTSGFAAGKVASGAAAGNPTNAVGLIRLSVAAGATKGQAVALTVPASYNVANTGDGSTTNARPGATGATSTTTAGDPVAAETITVATAFAPALATKAIGVPTGLVAVTNNPGDVNASIQAGRTNPVDVGDVALVANMVNRNQGVTPFRLVVADITPANGFSAADPGGTNGLGYGNGSVDVGDVAAIANAFKTGAPAAE